MVIRNVSSKSEPPMLKMVRMLRRLLRNAFLLTKRVKVIVELREILGTNSDPATPKTPFRIDDESGPLQARSQRATHLWSVLSMPRVVASHIADRNWGSSPSGHNCAPKWNNGRRPRMLRGRKRATTARLQRAPSSSAP